eukprot:gene3967-7223_t
MNLDEFTQYQEISFGRNRLISVVFNHEKNQLFTASSESLFLLDLQTLTTNLIDKTSDSNYKIEYYKEHLFIFGNTLKILKNDQVIYSSNLEYNSHYRSCCFFNETMIIGKASDEGIIKGNVKSLMQNHDENLSQFDIVFEGNKECIFVLVNIRDEYYCHGGNEGYFYVRTAHNSEIVKIFEHVKLKMIFSFYYDEKSCLLYLGTQEGNIFVIDTIYWKIVDVQFFQRSSITCIIEMNHKLLISTQNGFIHTLDKSNLVIQNSVEHSNAFIGEIFEMCKISDEYFAVCDFSGDIVIYNYPSVVLDVLNIILRKNCTDINFQF